MIYSEDHRLRHTVIVLLILCGTLYGALWYAGKLPDLLSSSQLKSQLLLTEEQTYLNSLTGAGSLSGIIITEGLLQKFIETLLIHSNEFDKTSAAAARDYLKTYFGIIPPVPPVIDEAVTTAADRFLMVSSIPATTTTAPVASPDFISNFQAILSGHEAAANNSRVAERAKTGRALLGELIKQL